MYFRDWGWSCKPSKYACARGSELWTCLFLSALINELLRTLYLTSASFRLLITWPWTMEWRLPSTSSSSSVLSCLLVAGETDQTHGTTSTRELQSYRRPIAPINSRLQLTSVLLSWWSPRSPLPALAQNQHISDLWPEVTNFKGTVRDLSLSPSTKLSRQQQDIPIQLF